MMTKKPETREPEAMTSGARSRRFRPDGRAMAVRLPKDAERAEAREAVETSAFGENLVRRVGGESVREEVGDGGDGYNVAYILMRRAARRGGVCTSMRGMA